MSEASFAKVTSKTSISYYKISAGSPASLYKQMSSRGPHVSGARAFASTGAIQRYKGDFLVRNNRCKIKNFKVNMKFKMALPRLAGKKHLNSKTQRQWSQFSRFVRQHENRHRSIWLGCARDADRAVRKIAAVSCSQAEKQVIAIFSRADKRCDKLHDAFDASERRRLNANPLIVAAKRPASKTRKRAIRLPKASKSFRRNAIDLR